ncbi:hypothetical protein [Sediminibacterium sp.]|uniref:hypothetical protein n=1 Tax=Sediminibacterium sp. TaxID=1917865 RepID=UPI003F71DE2D
MSIEIVNKADLENRLFDIFQDTFRFTIDESKIALLNIRCLTDIRDDIYIGIEFPYVDKLYRNSYYHYWGSKFKDYQRHCIRLSFFDKKYSITDFFDINQHENLLSSFLGFLIIRPIFIAPTGRNIFRPDIFKKNHLYYVAVTNGHAAISGVKFNVNGFPHSSQDGEMMVCAETALWSLLEYFSNRYSDYKPLLPNDIHRILSSNSITRQIPSKGLSISNISYVLKKIGFGVNWYSVSTYTQGDFFNLIKIYIESCVPVMAIIQNTQGVAHVMNIVGRTEYKAKHTFSVVATLANGANLYDFYEQNAEYIIIDDNLRPYSTINLNDPASNYSDPKFAGCEITAAIVPLYSRVYVESDQVKEVSFEFLKTISTKLNLPSYVVRVLLTSTRSYKSYLAASKDFSIDVKALLINLELPKFIWIAELSSTSEALSKKASGLLIFDATEPRSRIPIASLLKDLYIGELNGKIGLYTLPLPPFEIFQNLKTF